MNKKALTLIELIVTIVTGFIVAMAITVLFISEFRLREKMDDQIRVAREAEAVIDHVSRVLRFSAPGSFYYDPPPDPDNAQYMAMYYATIVGGQLDSLLPDESTYVVRYFYFHDYPAFEQFPAMTLAENRVEFHVVSPNPGFIIPYSDTRY